MCADCKPPRAPDRIERIQVHEALERLYDGLALGQTALAARLSEAGQPLSVSERAARLRAVLLEAIEKLLPERPASFRSPATRSYEVMTLHFVEGLPIAQVAQELSVSERQAYRDLLRAEESLAELLNSSNWQAAAPSSGAGAARGSALDRELEALPAQSQALDVSDLLNDALRTVEPLARRLGVALTSALPPVPWSVRGDPVLSRTSLVEMLSAALRSATSGGVRVVAQALKERIAIEVRFRTSLGPKAQGAFADLARLASAQNLPLALERSADGEVMVSLSLPRRCRRTVMVFEDNPSAVELYHRFLADSDEWELLVPADERQGLDMACQQRPTVIVLDVLMPRQNGWHVLQTLRAQPETSHIPVLVCSVFDDPDLAAALGASGYLKKPVTREQFLHALRQCLKPRHTRV